MSVALLCETLLSHVNETRDKGFLRKPLFSVSSEGATFMQDLKLFLRSLKFDKMTTA